MNYWNLMEVLNVVAQSVREYHKMLLEREVPGNLAEDLVRDFHAELLRGLVSKAIMTSERGGEKRAS